uniref:C2H2-type domain-containing protein n=1 Tax=Anopheles funestus TaxID=62324 RepID=A0A2Y9D1M2_ANOFN
MDLRELSPNDPTQNAINKQMLELPLASQHNINKSRPEEAVKFYQSDSDDPPRCTVQCTECGKWFLDHYFLSRHKLVHTKEKPHQCAKCLKSFTQKGSLATHMLIHLRVKKFQCSLCPMKFVQKGNLETHVKKRHPPLDDPVLENGFLCQKCPSAYKRAGRLQEHRARIHGEMVMFDQCLKQTTVTSKQPSNDTPSTEDNEHGDDTTSSNEGSSASTKAQLKTEHDGEIMYKIIKSRRTEHMNGRTDKRRYECEICKAAFQKSAYLTQHMISHTGIRPHRCNICNKTFTSKQSYSTHMKLHSNTVRLFSCDKCEEAFNRYAALKRHQTMMHSALKFYFRCPYCENRFRWLHNVRTHIKVFHATSTELTLLEPVKESIKLEPHQAYEPC